MFDVIGEMEISNSEGGRQCCSVSRRAWGITKLWISLSHRNSQEQHSTWTSTKGPHMGVLQAFVKPGDQCTEKDHDTKRAEYPLEKQQGSNMKGLTDNVKVRTAAVTETRSLQGFAKRTRITQLWWGCLGELCAGRPRTEAGRAIKRFW